MKNILIFRQVNWLLAIAITILLQLSFTPTTEATHFRYGNISWSRVAGGGGNQIQFKVTQAWRRSAFGAPIVGSVITTSDFYINNTYAGPVNITVTSVNAAEDWFYGEATINHTFPSTTGTHIVDFRGCCRISTLSNNHDMGFVISSTVTIGNQNDAPVTTIPPYINVQAGIISTFQIPFIDPNSDAVVASLTPNGTFGASNVQPTFISVSSTGLVTVDATAIPLNSLWNTNITLTDAKGAKVQLDIFLKMVTQSTPPAFDYTVTPNNSSNIHVTPGTPINFNVKAFDTDPGDIVDLSGVGIPVGASFTNTSGNPTQSSFSWTPTAGQLGSHVVTFTAQDNNLAQVFSTVNLIVSSSPQFSSPGDMSTTCYTPGSAINATYNVTDADPFDQIILSATSGVVAGMSFTPALPTAAANPAAASMTWNTTAADWGLHTVVMKATDMYGDFSNNTQNYIVNNPPVITSTANTSVLVGQYYSYTVTATDANSAQGDVISVESVILPSFLTIVDNMDGTWTISGTPSAADVGVHNVLVELQDLMNHINGTHCGNTFQTYNLTVIPCTAIASITTNNSPTIPGHQNNTIYLGYGDQFISMTASMSGGSAPYTYDWSPAASLNVSNAATVQASPTATQLYQVVITDMYGCKDTAYQTINVIDARCGGDSNKVIVCHIPPGNPANAHDICISPNGVPAHLAHGCFVGPCGSNNNNPTPYRTASGTNQFTEGQSINIFPNPATHEIQISMTAKEVGAHLVISDIQGRVIKSEKIANASMNVNVSALPRGMYIIGIIYSDNSQERFKLMLQ